MNFFVFYFLLFNTLSIYSKNWQPAYENEKSFFDPFDYVNENDLPNFKDIAEGYDWVGIAGSTLSDKNISYVAFSGTKKNMNKSYDSVYTKQSGIIVLCSSKSNSLGNGLDFQLDCKILEENHLKTSDSKYFGINVRSAKIRSDTIGFVYCDPLWVDITYNNSQPSGKCKLSLVKDISTFKHREYRICDKHVKCLGGFSVDIDEDINLIFGLPFENATLLLKSAESSQIKDAKQYKGNFFNYGYSVAFSGDGNHFISSPVSDEQFPFIDQLKGDKIVPKNPKTQNYGGFGTSIDTVKVGNSLYGIVIGAPYQSKQNLVNVGAVFLACKGHETDMVSGENQYDYFGYAVARLGDIDYDDVEEFVVSSPSLNYERPGKIYIYKTTSDCKISKKPLQIHQSKINGFGIAISRGFDINSNKMPDFFVTALDYQRPLLFKMPNQEKVTCSWVDQNKGHIYSINEEFDIKIIFDSLNIKNFDNYFFQLAIDYSNQGDHRFSLVNSKLYQKTYIIKLKTLMDVQDMDLKMNPLKVAIRGIRMCKFNGTCYNSKVPNIDWSKCDQIIKLPVNLCPSPNCVSDLNLIVSPDPKGSIIYYGERKDYQRQLQITINNKGPDITPRLYLSIESRGDFSINVDKCHSLCKVKLSNNEQNVKIINKARVEKWDGNRDDFNITVDILYKELENVSSETSINFNLWGINDDTVLINNNYTATYKILFRPKMIFSSKNTKRIFDQRIKPPYLEPLKRVEVTELGTELQYSYIIENKGAPLKNVDFKIYFPYQTQTNNILLYIMDKIRLKSDSTVKNVLPSISNKTHIIQYCQVSKEMVNPLQLNVFKKSGALDRSRRAISDETSSMTNDTVIRFSSEDEKLNNFISTNRKTLIKCNESSKAFGLPICGEITCRLDYVPMNSEFILNFRTWLFTKTFFDAQIADIEVVTSLQSNLGDFMPGISVLNNLKMVGPFAVSHNILFEKMKIPDDKHIPLWPIIVAVIIGIFLLVIIIIIAYYCGFFKRKRLMKERKKIREQALKEQSFNDEEPLNANS